MTKEMLEIIFLASVFFLPVRIMIIKLVKFKITPNGSFYIFAFKIYNKDGYKKRKMNMIKNRRS